MPRVLSDACPPWVFEVCYTSMCRSAVNRYDLWLPCFREATFALSASVPFILHQKNNRLDAIKVKMESAESTPYGLDSE